VAAFDLFTFVFDGGIYREGFIQLWGEFTRQLDSEVPPVPVDEDPERTMMNEAVRQHRKNSDIIQEMKDVQYRDEGIMADFSGNMPSARVEAVNRSGIPIYISSGWYDIYPRDPFQMFANFTGPVKVMMGPWPHGYWNDAVGQERGRITKTERLRWFDHWLRGIENGIMGEPPINYSVMREPGVSWSWRQSDSWPPQAEKVVYYLRGGESGTIDSVNDGDLSPAAPGVDEAFDVYTVDEEGFSHYISEGQLRASCRALGDPPYDNLDLPFHPVSKDGVRKLKPGEPVELILDLLPVSNVFDAGNRIRVTVTCADAYVSRILKPEPASAVRIYRSRGRLSHVELPFIN
jgi:predicted acyl esterase